VKSKSLGFRLAVSAASAMFASQGGAQIIILEKTYDPADSFNWAIEQEVQESGDWQTVDRITGLVTSGTFPLVGTAMGYAANVYSNPYNDAWIKHKVNRRVTATWIGLGPAPSEVRMYKLAHAQAYVDYGNVSASSGIGIEPIIQMLDHGKSLRMGGSKPFNLSGSESWLTSVEATCSGNLGSACADV
jgi:hypothetical protein